MLGRRGAVARSNAAQADHKAAQDADPISLYYKPHLLGHERMNYSGTGNFQPIGEELGAFLTEGDAELFALKEARRRLQARTDDPEVLQGLGEYIAKTELKRTVELHNKKRDTEYRLWLLGKHKELNEKHVTPWGYTTLGICNPEITAFVQRGIRVQYMFNMFAYRLYFAAPQLTTKEAEWYFRYLVEPLREWAKRKVDQHKADPDERKRKPKYWMDDMKRVSSEKNYPYPHACLDPVYNHWFWRFSYQYTPINEGFIMGQHQFGHDDIVKNLPELREIELYSHIGDAEGWDPMFVNRPGHEWDPDMRINPLYNPEMGELQRFRQAPDILNQSKRPIGEGELNHTKALSMDDTPAHRGPPSRSDARVAPAEAADGGDDLEARLDALRMPDAPSQPPGDATDPEIAELQARLDALKFPSAPAAEPDPVAIAIADIQKEIDALRTADRHKKPNARDREKIRERLDEALRARQAYMEKRRRGANQPPSAPSAPADVPPPPPSAPLVPPAPPADAPPPTATASTSAAPQDAASPPTAPVDPLLPPRPDPTQPAQATDADKLKAEKEKQTKKRQADAAKRRSGRKIEWKPDAAAIIPSVDAAMAAQAAKEKLPSATEKPPRTGRKITFTEDKSATISDVDTAMSVQAAREFAAKLEDPGVQAAKDYATQLNVQAAKDYAASLSADAAKEHAAEVSAQAARDYATQLNVQAAKDYAASLGTDTTSPAVDAAATQADTPDTSKKRDTRKGKDKAKRETDKEEAKIQRAHDNAAARRYTMQQAHRTMQRMLNRVELAKDFAANLNAQAARDYATKLNVEAAKDYAQQTNVDAAKDYATQLNVEAARAYATDVNVDAARRYTDALEFERMMGALERNEELPQDINMVQAFLGWVDVNGTSPEQKAAILGQVLDNPRVTGVWREVLRQRIVRYLSDT